MVTRLRPLGSWFGAPSVSPAFDSGWNVTTGAVRRHLHGPSSPAGWRVAYTDTGEMPGVGETDASVVDVLIAQFISGPLSGAQSVSGTLKGQMRCSVNVGDGSADFRSQVLAKVISNDGSTVRGVLLPFDTGALSSEWDWTWGRQGFNRKCPRGGAQTLSSVSAQDGDRIVIEMGARAHNIVTASKIGYVYMERGEATSDLPESEGEELAYWPWFEFSTDLTFATPEVRVTSVLLEVVMNNPDPEVRVSTYLMEVISEEFWHGWGVVMDSGQD